MEAYIYTCPECGGKLTLVTTDTRDKLRQCEGCTALYLASDPALLPYVFNNPKVL